MNMCNYILITFAEPAPAFWHNLAYAMGTTYPQ